MTSIARLRPLRAVTEGSRPILPVTQKQLHHRNIRSPKTLFYHPFSSGPARYADLVVKVPPMAESISEGTMATIHKQIGDHIEPDEELASIETDKIDIAVNAAQGGVIIELFAKEGDVVTVGQSIARIETGSAGASQSPKSQSQDQGSNNTTNAPRTPPSAASRESRSDLDKDQPIVKPSGDQTPAASGKSSTSESTQKIPEHNTSPHPKHESAFRSERVENLSRMRKTIATRLKQSQNTCASLTTIQEIDMTALIHWRAKYKEDVAKRHGVRLGYMGAFAKATARAAKLVPEINASIDTDRESITFRDYVDISIAVSSPKGLVTPVVKDCDKLSIVELEKQIAIVAQKARDAKLTMDDLTGGNFSISNPGIFNSLFGTPVINYPQAAVFNMNTIKDRVVAINGKVEIRPMMYVTVTYDHRLIDGREAVSFLNIVKSYIEDPARMLLA